MLVGSGAHCEVRLPVEHAGVEHLAVEARQAMVFAEARTLAPPPFVGGAPFLQGRLLPTSVVRIGGVELSISLLHLDAGAPAKRQRTSKPNLRTCLLGALAIALSLYVLANSRKPSSALSMPMTAPELFAKENVPCAVAGREEAFAYADELRLGADTKRERAPFRPEEGVAAVGGYRRAAVCFKHAGHPAEAAAASTTADELQQRIVADYRLHRLRLERLLVMQEWEAAKREIRLLTALLEGKPGEYLSWLSNVDRRITIKFAAGKDHGATP